MNWGRCAAALAGSAVLCAAPFAAPAAAWAAPLVTPDDDGWQMGNARPLRAAPLQRVALCDFARLAAQQQAVPVADDPVFRQPSAEGKSALGRARKALIAGESGGAAQMEALLRGAEGPSLARLALQDRDRAVQTAAASAAAALARQHPRLFAFLPIIDPAMPAPLAQALLRLDFATGCDTPALYALDALEHPAPEVVELAVRLAVRQASQVRSAAPINRVVAWLERRSGPSRVRVLALRRVGALGLVHLSGAFERLSRDADPLVAGEARVAWARVAPGAALPQWPSWWSDARPCAQVAALRAAAELGADHPEPLLPRLRAALAAPGRCRDPLTQRDVSVGAAAAAVFDFWELRGVTAGGP